MTSQRAYLLAVARPTFDINVAQSNLTEAIRALESAGFEVLGSKALVMTPDDVSQEQARYQSLDPAPDVDILLLASFCDSTPATTLFALDDYEASAARNPVLLWSFPEPGQPGERLLLNSLCGANLSAHALVHAGRPVRHLHGEATSEAVTGALADLVSGEFPRNEPPSLVKGMPVDRIAGQQALNWLSGKVIASIGEAPPGFTPCYQPSDVILRQFGVTTAPEALSDFFQRLKRVEPVHQAHEHDRALAEQPSLASVPQGEALTVASTTVALTDLKDEVGADAVALRCWPDFAVDLGACPCSALSRLSDRGVATACERDILGSLNLLLLAGLGEEPTYLVDVVDITPEQDIVRIWHCGAAATKLAVDPKNATQWLHCNRKLGVAGNFALQTGIVTLVRLDTKPGHPEQLRMLLTSAESIAAENRFQGNTATLKVSDSKRLINGLMVGGFPHHFAVAWADVRPGLRAVAEILDIDLIEW
jgi:L-fucose isomerase-like protein